MALKLVVPHPNVSSRRCRLPVYVLVSGMTSRRNPHNPCCLARVYTAAGEAGRQVDGKTAGHPVQRGHSIDIFALRWVVNGGSKQRDVGPVESVHVLVGFSPYC